jgi:hypothetical protein
VAAAVLGCAVLVAEAPVLKLTATTANVAGAPDAIRFDIFRWSTDAERDQLLAAWAMRPAAPAAAPAGAPAGAGGAAPAAAGRGGGGRGGGGRGGGGRGGRGGEAAPTTPEQALAAAIGKATTVGYLWSSEVAGYSLRYAAKSTLPDGTEKIILITDRRLGDTTQVWKPAGADELPYEFSIIELHLNAKGEGEGKASLTGKIAIDGATKSIGLENYAALPVILKGVNRGK